MHIFAPRNGNSSLKDCEKKIKIILCELKIFISLQSQKKRIKSN